MTERPALEEYRRRRDPARTPEPFAEPTPAAAGRTFVVQRHSARRLHYDLRLEQDGVLRSWAVPKGLPTVPGSRRLAVHTEDHPLAYATFSGVIPKGEYGAGTMDVYDSGTYEVVEQKRDGGLSFRLHGRKLQGVWTLVPAHLDGEERNWLLIRKRLPGEPEQSAEHVRYEPMLATLVESAPHGEDWTYEVKWDGFRSLARLADGEPELWSRRGNDLTERFAEVAADLGRGLRTPNCVVDGEVCALDEHGRPSFQRLQSGTGRLVLYVFDLLELEGERLLERPLHERRAQLAELVDETSKLVRLSHAFEDGDALLAAARERGLEGIMAKRLSSPYLTGRRTRDWQKVKVRQEAVFAIAGFTRGEGARERLGSLVLAARDGQDLVYVGHVGTGFTDAEIDRLLALLTPLRRDTSPLSRPVKDPRLRRGRVVWVEPRVRCRVEFVEWTDDGRIRAPSYKGLCRDEGGIVSVPSAELADEEAAAEAERAPATARAFGNLERVLFPGDGITKGDLLDYYRRVAPVLLPHLRDRPFTMRRAPEGIDGGFFWVKDAPSFMPAWIDRVEIAAETRRGRAKETVAYPIVDDVPALLWMVAMGCIDLHVTLSRAATWHCPDYVLFDLDPCRDATFADVVRVAHHVRDALSGLGLEVYAKTSGRDGMHLCVPIGSGPSFDETRTFAHAVATAVERAYPDEATAEWVKERRHGVFVDWKQNSLAATIVPPYSVRPVPGAPVSCPLGWDEVREDLDPRGLGMPEVLERVERLGDLFAPVLEGGQDLAPFLRR